MTLREAGRGVAIALAVLVSIRIAIPLAALAAEGARLPGLPPYRYDPLVGDANDFYATARMLVSTFGREAPLVVLLGVAVAALAFAARRLCPLRWVRLAVLGWAVGAALASVIALLPAHGAGTVGWPLLWAAGLAPLRAIGALDLHTAFGVGLTLSLLANAVTVVATGVAALRATGSRLAGVAAAALFSLWPLLVGVVGGERTWRNGTWHVDVGLNLYGEPLSTALVAVAAALLLGRAVSREALLAVGALLGFATTVRLSNAVLAVLAVVLVAAWRRSLRAPLPVLAGALASAPVVIAYWPFGYVGRDQGPALDGEPLFALAYAARSWNDSLLFTPAVLAVLLLPAAAGLVVVSRRAAGLAAAFALGTAAFYTFYGVTWEHPRFLFVAFPLLFVLQGAALARLGGLVHRPASSPPGRRAGEQPAAGPTAPG